MSKMPKDFWKTHVVDEDPHAPNLNADTKYGFIWNGVHFERCHDDKRGGIYVYISSKKEQKMIRITKGGRITLESVA